MTLPTAALLTMAALALLWLRRGRAASEAPAEEQRAEDEAFLLFTDHE